MCFLSFDNCKMFCTWLFVINASRSLRTAAKSKAFIAAWSGSTCNEHQDQNQDQDEDESMGQNQNENKDGYEAKLKQWKKDDSNQNSCLSSYSAFSLAVTAGPGECWLQWLRWHMSDADDSNFAFDCINLQSGLFLGKAHLSFLKTVPSPQVIGWGAPP